MQQENQWENQLDWGWTCGDAIKTWRTLARETVDFVQVSGGWGGGGREWGWGWCCGDAIKTWRTLARETVDFVQVNGGWGGGEGMGLRMMLWGCHQDLENFGQENSGLCPGKWGGEGGGGWGWGLSCGAVTKTWRTLVEKTMDFVQVSWGGGGGGLKVELWGCHQDLENFGWENNGICCTGEWDSVFFRQQSMQTHPGRSVSATAWTRHSESDAGPLLLLSSSGGWATCQSAGTGCSTASCSNKHNATC